MALNFILRILSPQFSCKLKNNQQNINNFCILVYSELYGCGMLRRVCMVR